MKRRILLTALGSVATASLTGCLGGGEGSTPESPSPSEAADIVRPGDGDYPHPIRVDNSLEREVILTISVAREGTQIYQESHTVAEGADVVVAGITEASLSEDSRSVSVTASESFSEDVTVDVSVSDCLGEIVFYFGTSESLEATYSSC